MLTSHKNTKERREHPRVDNNIPLKISSDEGDVVTETWNLSRTGVYCRVNRFINMMTKLKIHLLLPLKKKSKSSAKKIVCSGVVVRTEAISGTEDYNIAVFFNDIQQKDSDVISEYISQEMDD